MGTPGRKRAPIKDRFSAEDEALSSIAREAEARLAAKRVARAEARDIRMRELERQQKEKEILPFLLLNQEMCWGAACSQIKSRYLYINHLSHLFFSFPCMSMMNLVLLFTVSEVCAKCMWIQYSDKGGDPDCSCSSQNSSDDDTASTVSQERYSRGRRDSVSAADYFSRSNRRGSIVSDLDDLCIPDDLDALDEKCDKTFVDYSRPSSRCTTPGLSPATLASLGGTSSRRGSADTGSIVDPDTSLSELRDIYDLKDQIQDVEGRYMQGLKELKESLSEVEEKYKKAMVSNAQLDNDKTNLIYSVDTLKDVIEEMEEQMAEMRRETEDKSKELERQKHTCTVLQHKQVELKEGIRQRDELIEKNQRIQTNLDTLTREVFDLQETINWKDKKIGALERQKEYFDCIRNERDELRDELADIKAKAKTGEKHGLVIIPEGMPNGDISHDDPATGITVVTQEAAQVLESAGEGPLGEWRGQNELY
uniref:Leucine-rich repeat flightless-interacting protein 2 n=1 Tax=Hucho hucho TaxID=62062 RepID=A0A4W5NML3_9TELE